MPIDLQQVINSPYTVGFVSAVGRLLPPAAAYPACDLIGRWVADRRQSALTQAVRLNQWMARGAKLSGKELDRAVRETFQNNTRDLYELYHHLKDPETLWHRLCLNSQVKELIDRPEFAGRGLMAVGIHLSGFDAAMVAMIRHGARAFVLTIPDPQGARRVEFEMRKRTGMHILPASLDALRQAARHLEHGGLVLTGIDRPIQGPRLQPRFFGQPAPLPTHHIFLALKARVPVVLLAVIRQKDGMYKILSSEPMEMERERDHDAEILHNAERVLKQAENFIRLAPEQWNVPLPVWPELCTQVPV